MSAAERPLHHEREFLLPKGAAMLSDSLPHDDVRARIAQRGCPAGRILQEERFQGAGDEVDAWKPTRQLRRWLLTGARRSAEDGTVDIWMAKPDCKRQLRTCRDSEHTGPFGKYRYAKPRRCPPSEVVDEELLVCREPVRVEARRILGEPQSFVGEPVNADDHCRGHVQRCETRAPLRDQLSITGEYDCLRRARWNINGDPTPTVVVERLGDQISCHGRR